MWENQSITTGTSLDDYDQRTMGFTIVYTSSNEAQTMVKVSNPIQTQS